MPKTGIGLLEILALVAILLPLLPVFIIFISKAYKQDLLALLMGLCLVSFIQNLILYIPRFVPLDMLFIKASFQLINYIILLLLLKVVIIGKWQREGLKILLVSFASVVITIYSTQGIAVYLGNIEIVQALLLILVTLIALFQLIRGLDIFIFLSPMFWIAGGTFFYYSMFLITQSIPEYKSVLQGTPLQQKKALLLIIIIIQFIFYIIAAIVAGNKNKENRMILY
ncbi:MAG: hypothetical protein H7122_18365 [Chitinophagaceae bacterium]|nr:hypothetical protein [Chitinophagaceae bacterium]